LDQDDDDRSGDDVPGTSRGGLPFALLFAEPIPVERLTPRHRYDVTAELATNVRRPRPTGRRDKVLIVTSKYDDHADAVALELVARGCAVFRFDVESFPAPARLSLLIEDGAADGRVRWQGTLQTPVGELALTEVRSVWLRRRILELFGLVPPPDDAGAFVRRESDATFSGLAALAGDAFWVSAPHALWRAESKFVQLQLAVELGLAIPRTLVTNDPAEARAFVRAVPNTVVKAFRGQIGATVESTRLIYANRIGPEHAADLDLVRNGPCLLQEEVPKAADVRVTVIGGRLFATELQGRGDGTDPLDCRKLDPAGANCRAIDLPPTVASLCMRLVDRLALEFGAIDLVRTPDDRYVFLEINVNGQWLWIEKLTRMPIADAIASLLVKGRGAPAVALPTSEHPTNALRGAYAADVLTRV